MALIVDRDNISHASRVLDVSLDEVESIASALSSPLRIAILKALRDQPMNVAEIAEMFSIPASTAAVNVKKLESADLIRTEMVPGSRGTQKICAGVISRIVVNILEEKIPPKNYVEVAMPIGQFTDCAISPTCGLVDENAIIGEFDDARSFYEPQHIQAQLLWFHKGFVEYKFPARIPTGSSVSTFELSMEICSEAPLYNPQWPSDITIWINGHEIGTWTSPGDFGGTKGYLTPEWWGTQNTQYGLLKTWRVASDGSYIDGRQISNVTINTLALLAQPFITVRIGVKDEAENCGGVNLFGKHFGNYETDLTMRLECVKHSTTATVLNKVKKDEKF